ncbi:MAG: toxin-antitoxin system, toxin component, Txe/YoeB family [Mucilaginibacter sp.]|nr:toxin-antitoxin system, toxin component, Txe/YoeB family [Mucilaginibacter sp.]
MELVITDTAKDDIRFFLKSGQSSLVKKIENLLVSIKQTPYAGVGKPEPLKYEYSGKWSKGGLTPNIGLFTRLGIIPFLSYPPEGIIKINILYSISRPT